MLRSLITAFVLLAPVATLSADSHAVPEVTHAWARATPPGMTMGVVYLTLRSYEDDQLVGASTPLAASVQMHESRMSHDVMTMRPLTLVALPRSSTVVFEPSGKHFMLLGLRKPLVDGDDLPFTLTFAKAGSLTVIVKVRKDE